MHNWLCGNPGMQIQPVRFANTAEECSSSCCFGRFKAPVTHAVMPVVPLAVQMRSKRNFCIDIVLVCILLGIGAYIFTLATKKKT